MSALEEKLVLVITFKKEIYLILNYVYICVCAHEHRCPQRTEAPGPLELSNVFMSHLTWMLGMDLGSSGRVASCLSTESCLQDRH